MLYTIGLGFDCECLYTYLFQADFRLMDFKGCLSCRVNWKPAKSSSTVKQGDVISCAGKGRVEVGEINETKKGRFAVNMVRYV